tara:strand:+ start:3296 stop:4132 length:837 start_codon:yes stop_codon:yes gene_type:complete
MIKTINISEDNNNLYNYLSSAITPRPIAFVSTTDNNGNSNLSPFSFFNVFSVNPPIIIFSPVTSIQQGTNKHTLDNILKNKECVVAMVNEKIGQQMSLTSCNFDKGVNEFKKAGFTEVKSDSIAPSRVKEAPINFECKVNEVIVLGEKSGAGNLVLAEIIKIHIDYKVLDDKENIDPFKLNIISRYGGDWYGKTTNESLYKIKKPLSKIGIGFDNLPKQIKESKTLNGSDLAVLASSEKIPQKKKTDKYEDMSLKEKHILAKDFLSQDKIEEAWQILL